MFSITVFKMPLDSGRLLSINLYWKIQLVVSRLFAGDNRLSADTSIIFLFEKHQVLLINRTNQPLVNITYSWHTFFQQNLFLACFVHNHSAGDLIWFNVTYSWHTFWSQLLMLATSVVFITIPGIRFVNQ